MKKFVKEALELISIFSDQEIGLEINKRRKIIGVSNLNTRRIIINPDNIRNIHALRLVILHEIGHFHFPFAKTEEDLEYLAHSFALDTISNFYMESFNYAIKSLVETIEYCEENKNIMKAHGVHYRAFKRIFEEMKENNLL